MPLGDRAHPCLFSRISGIIMLNDAPVKNARVERIVDKAHTRVELIDETRTDDTGYFEMPAIFDRVLLAKILPMEFAVHQRIFVYYDGIKHEMWDGVKRQREENAESRGKPLVVTCELSSEMELIEVNWSPIFSKCKWDVEPDPPLIITPPEEDV